MKKRIASLVMLVVLAVGIALTAYGVTGRGIYDNAANMMGVNKKEAMSFIQDPSTLTAVGNVNDIGADKVKGFLKGLGLDAAKVDAAVDERSKYESAVAGAKDRETLLAYAHSVDETITEETYADLVKDSARFDQMKKDYALQQTGVDEAAFAELESNTALVELYRQGVPDILNNRHMTNAVPVMFVGIVLLVAAGTFFLIKAMSLKPRARTRAAFSSARS